MDVRTKRIFKFVFITLFVDLLAFSLILPLLPKILDYYAENDKSNFYQLFDENVKVLQKLLNVPESHNQVLLAGILGSWFSLLQFISSPFLGSLSDQFGRRPILLMALSGTVVSYAVWFASVDSFGLFVISRTIGGLCKANVGLSLAIISDVSNESTRGKGMAIVGSSFSLAFIIGPSLGAYLSTLAKENQIQQQLIVNPALIATLLAIVNLALVVIFVEETNITFNKKGFKANPNRINSRISSHEGSPLSRAFYYVNPKSLFSFDLVEQKTKEESEILRKAGLIYFYYLLFYSGLEFTLSFLTHIRFQFSSREQGYLYLFSGILMAIIQGGCIRRMKGGNEPFMALVGLTFIVPSFVLMGISTDVTQIYYSLTMYAFSSALVVPCMTTIVSSYSPINARGVVMGTFRSIGSLARALGPCIASSLFWTSGSTICYIVGALALLIPLYMMKDLYYLLKQPSLRAKDKKLAASENLAKAS